MIGWEILYLGNEKMINGKIINMKRLNWKSLQNTNDKSFNEMLENIIENKSKNIFGCDFWKINENNMEHIKIWMQGTED